MSSYPHPHVVQFEGRFGSSLAFRTERASILEAILSFEDALDRAAPEQWTVWCHHDTYVAVRLDEAGFRIAGAASSVDRLMQWIRDLSANASALGPGFPTPSALDPAA